ncbi:MAG: tRNA 2-selenouridine(34) synthase MnmH, partial [Bacteroidota bacterium]
MSAAVIEEFLSLYKTSGQLLIDSRSEGEFARGHIPGSLNVPILNDESRAIVGTTYKKNGRQEAVLKGLELSGPLFHSLVLKVSNLCNGSPVMVYCWRGGMRSGILCWLLNLAGIKTTVLSGGYKRYRNWSLHQFTINRKLIILGGRTGSGKTEMLQRLKDLGENMICLEGLASHKGSAFGSLGQAEQPTQEHFENELAFALSNIDDSDRLWLENESRNVGRIKIP